MHSLPAYAAVSSVESLVALVRVLRQVPISAPLGRYVPRIVVPLASDASIAQQAHSLRVGRQFLYALWPKIALEALRGVRKPDCDGRTRPETAKFVTSFIQPSVLRKKT